MKKGAVVHNLGSPHQRGVRKILLNKEPRKKTNEEPHRKMEEGGGDQTRKGGEKKEGLGFAEKPTAGPEELPGRVVQKPEKGGHAVD